MDRMRTNAVGFALIGAALCVGATTLEFYGVKTSTLSNEIAAVLVAIAGVVMLVVGIVYLVKNPQFPPS